MKHFLRSAAFLSCAIALCGCGAEVLGYKTAIAGFAATREGIFLREDVNLKEKNYAAADYLIGALNSRLNINDTFKVLPLEESDNPGITSPLGATISEGVGLRIAELGYTVDMTHVDQIAAPLPPVSLEKSDYLFGGVYAIERGEVAVSLRISDAQNGALIKRFDYAMPLTRDLRQLAKTEPQTLRLTPSTQ